MKDLFIILLHGVGSNGEDLEAVGEFFLRPIILI